jgi:hypothetical protein
MARAKWRRKGGGWERDYGAVPERHRALHAMANMSPAERERVLDEACAWLNLSAEEQQRQVDADIAAAIRKFRESGR